MTGLKQDIKRLQKVENVRRVCGGIASKGRQNSGIGVVDVSISGAAMTLCSAIVVATSNMTWSECQQLWILTS